MCLTTIRGTKPIAICCMHMYQPQTYESKIYSSSQVMTMKLTRNHKSNSKFHKTSTQIMLYQAIISAAWSIRPKTVKFLLIIQPYRLTFNWYRTAQVIDVFPSSESSKLPPITLLYKSAHMLKYTYPTCFFALLNAQIECFWTPNTCLAALPGRTTSTSKVLLNPNTLQTTATSWRALPLGNRATQAGSTWIGRPTIGVEVEGARGCE
jgi:hypothetical protein